MFITLTEYGVFHHPTKMKGWRYYRIEYGGVHEEQWAEGNVWLPPNADPRAFELFLIDYIDRALEIEDEHLES